jgi:short-subunit dehydrogenase
LPFDVRDDDAMRDAVARAIEWAGDIDVLVNNAGISQRSLAVDTDMQVYRDIVDVDLMAPIALTQAMLSHFTQRGSGKLIFISSVAGKVGVPLRTAYCAAKHGLVGYADALRAELSQSGVDVHVVVPGSIATDVSRNALTADGSPRGKSDKAIENGLPPEDAAGAIANAVALNQREIVVAKGMEEAMGEARRTPDQLFDQVAQLMARGYADKMGVKDT